MTPRVPLSRFHFAPVSVVGSMLVTAPAFGCLNGDHFHPARPFSVPPFAVKPAVAPPHAGPPKFEAPQLEPLMLDGLLKAPVPEAAVAIAATPTPVVPEDLHSVFASFVREFEAKQMDTAAFSKRLDYSVALVRLGRYADAITQLVRLEAAYPGRYQTAANLGTAHELAGNLEEAVVWIARGIERNPAAHYGTEWLHLAILRAKLKLRSEPGWLKEHSVLDGIEAPGAEAIVRAIDYQLGERLQFVDPPDAIVADLFYQAARRVTGDDAAARRVHYARESMRFGELRRVEIEKLKG